MDLFVASGARAEVLRDSRASQFDRSEPVPTAPDSDAGRNSSTQDCQGPSRQCAYFQETQNWLSLHPSRFEFVFTPKHGSWLNIVETMFSEMARSMLRGVRVASKQELVDRIHLYFEQINADPVIYRAKAILYLGVRDCGDSAMFIINSVADYPAILVKDGAARVNYFTDDCI